MINFIAKIFFFLTFVFANSINIYPLIYGTYDSKGGTWNQSNDNILLGGWGLISTYEKNNLFIELDFYNNRFFGINNRPNFFSKEQGLSWWKAVDSGNNPNNENFDFDVTNAKINYRLNEINFVFGKFNKHWGPGKSSLSISNKSPSFIQFGFDWKLNEKINFEYFHGSLNSLITDSTNIDYYNQVGIKNPKLNRYIAAHRLDFKILPNLNLGFTEMVVYGVRDLELMYLLPVVPFWSIQHYLGDLDNIQMGVDFEYNFTDKVNLYGAFLIDEWSPASTFDENERNWFAYQVGFKGNNILFQDNYTLEYNWVDHRVYRHRFSINDFYNHGYPLGFWAGPHSQELYFNYNINIKNYILEIDFSDAKRGELTSEMLINQYDDRLENYVRFSNKTESIKQIQIIMHKNIYKGLIINFGLNLIDWKNSNFDPYNPYDNNLMNVKKESLIFGVSYNFNIKNQKSHINKNSIRLYND